MKEKKGIRIAAFVLDWFLFLIFVFLSALVIVFPSVVSVSGTSPLDGTTEVILQTLVYLILAIAAMTRQKTVVLLSIVFALTASTAFSILGDFNSLIGIVAIFEASWQRGLETLFSIFGDFLLAAAAIVFCVSVLQDDGRQTLRASLILLLCSLPFFTATFVSNVMLVISTFATEGFTDSSLFSSVFFIALYSTSLLSPLCYFFNVDGYCYARKLFTHGQK